jgi:predicted transcriptional regulator of viral defense system
MPARRLGNLERLLLSYAQMRKTQVLRSGELVKPLRITAKQERELFSRMARSGLIAKVRRGLYLIPETLPLGGKWTPDTALAINTLMADDNGKYQITGLSAFNRYGYSEQIPQSTFAYNNRLSAKRRIGAITLVLIKVRNERLGDTETVTSQLGGKLVYSSRVRTLVDAVYDWSRFNTLPRAYTWIRNDLKSKRITAPDLVRVTIKYGNDRTTRRIGAILEREHTSATVLKKLSNSFPAPRTIILLVPRGPRTGRVLDRWGVQMNEHD